MKCRFGCFNGLLQQNKWEEMETNLVLFPVFGETAGTGKFYNLHLTIENCEIVSRKARNERNETKEYNNGQLKIAGFFHAKHATKRKKRYNNGHCEFQDYPLRKSYFVVYTNYFSHLDSTSYFVNRTS
jgi:hypothetical protein